MIRLSELAGHAAGGETVWWDQRSPDVQSVIQSARTLRAAYIADFLYSGITAFGRWSGLSTLHAALRHRRQCRRTLNALAALDNRLLNDIGIDRAEIAATAALSCGKPAESSGSVWPGLAAWARRELRRRRTLRELSAMSDEMLADIGITRSEIPAVVAALFVEHKRQGSGSESVNVTTDIPVTAEILAFMEVRRGSQQAANRNLDRPAA